MKIMSEIEKLKCSKCGNYKKFYREINLIGKIRVDNKGKVLKQVYDINKSGEMFTTIRCCECNDIVLDDCDLTL